MVSDLCRCPNPITSTCEQLDTILANDVLARTIDDFESDTAAEIAEVHQNLRRTCHLYRAAELLVEPTLDF